MEEGREIWEWDQREGEQMNGKERGEGRRWMGEEEGLEGWQKNRRE